MNPEQLGKLVKAHFDAHAPRYGLEGRGVTVEYRFYGGSLQKRHFTISEGAAAYHLKLADAPRRLAGLRKWHNLRDILHERYRAPRILDWIDIPDTGYGGLLCEHIPGHPADLGASPYVTREIADLVSQLHADGELSAMLLPLTPEGTCADYFNGVWARRLRRDLADIEAQPPDFVASETLEWMKAEALAVERAVAGMEAFSPRASSPVHGDLWPGNILAADDGRIRIVDWDDIALGDPALEFAVLLEPIMEMNPKASLADLLRREPDAAFRQRFETCLRAQKLYAPIEAAAEYIEAEALEDRADAVRAERRAQYRETQRAYRRRYGAG